MQSQRELSAKDQAHFRQIVKFYESKQYKKGIKTCDSILKSYPDHGETLCMKGLLLNSLDKKDEAYDLARKGLKLNLKSHVCWHVLGLLYRSDRNYMEAAKCYKSALRMDPGNAQIMRDLGLLQLHERDLVGFAESRRQLLAAKPGNKQHWLSFAIAEHLRGCADSALDVLTKMDESFIESEEYVGPYEKSELCLYKAALALQSHQLDKATLYLESDCIVDQISKLEMLLYVHHLRGDMFGAKSVVSKLVSINPTHEGYLLCLLAVLNVLSPSPSSQHIHDWLRLGDSGFSASKDWSLNQRVKVSLPNRSRKVLRTCSGIVLRDFQCTDIAQLDVIKNQYLGESLKSDPYLLISLYLLPGDSKIFATKLTKFVESKLNKGVPSTFKLLKGLVVQSETKRIVIEKVLNEFVDDKTNHSPVFSTFTLLAKAQYSDFIGDYESANQTIDKALKITPTLTDLYVVKSKVLKHLGEVSQASEYLEKAREMDLADRYLNSKSVKGLLRNGEIDKANETIMLFSKDTADVKKSNLNEMQCMWWEFEYGKALAKKGFFNEALNVWSDTRKHYSDMAEDEFDFAFYCLRKMTLRAYIDFLRLEDRLMGHVSFRKVCKEMIPLLLKVARGEVSERVIKSEDGKAKPDWFKDRDSASEANNLIKDLLKDAPRWKGSHKLAFQVHLYRKEYNACVENISKLSSLGSSKVSGYVEELRGAIAGHPDAQSIESELSKLI